MSTAEPPPPRDALELCLQRIEARLDWGAAADWQTVHFEELTESILAETGVQLSVATLKRVWGHVAYSSSPSRTTLDTLARFAGFAGWVEAQATWLGMQAPPPEPLPQPEVPIAPPRPAAVPTAPAAPPTHATAPATRNWRPLAVGFLGVLLAAILVGTLATHTPTYKGPPVQVERFDFAPIARGLPNTVQFRYAVNGSSFDTLSIQQSWDPRLRHAVDPARGFYACTYYYPGVYTAKLLIDGVVGAEKSLVVPSEGWLGTIDQPAVEAPEYRSMSQLIGEDGALRITAPDINTNSAKAPQHSGELHFIGGLDGIDTEAGFRFSTSFRHERGDACRGANMVLYGERGTMIFPFVLTGCTGDIDLYVDQQMIDGRHTDLAGFGVSPDQWVRVDVELLDREVRVMRDGEEAFRQNLSHGFGRLLGVRYRFNGFGAVSEVSLGAGAGATPVALWPTDVPEGM